MPYFFFFFFLFSWLIRESIFKLLHAITVLLLNLTLAPLDLCARTPSLMRASLPSIWVAFSAHVISALYVHTKAAIPHQIMFFCANKLLVQAFMASLILQVRNLQQKQIQMACCWEKIETQGGERGATAEPRRAFHLCRALCRRLYAGYVQLHLTQKTLRGGALSLPFLGSAKTRIPGRNVWWQMSTWIASTHRLHFGSASSGACVHGHTKLIAGMHAMRSPAKMPSTMTLLVMPWILMILLVACITVIINSIALMGPMQSLLLIPCTLAAMRTNTMVMITASSSWIYLCMHHDTKPCSLAQKIVLFSGMLIEDIQICKIHVELSLDVLKVRLSLRSTLLHACFLPSLCN